VSWLVTPGTVIPVRGDSILVAIRNLSLGYAMPRADDGSTASVVETSVPLSLAIMLITGMTILVGCSKSATPDRIATVRTSAQPPFSRLAFSAVNWTASRESLVVRTASGVRLDCSQGKMWC